MRCEEPVCKRCGKCCHTVIERSDGTFYAIPCRYLIKYGTRTMCRIYGHRLGTKVYRNFKCIMREHSPIDYLDCPLNMGRGTVVEIKDCEATFIKGEPKNYVRKH